MSASDFVRRREMEPKLSLPHVRGEDGSITADDYIKENYCRLAAGGLYSSARDLIKLAQLILRGGITECGERIISEESLAEMLREHAVMKSGDFYGLTMMGHHLGGRIVYGHTGNADPYTSALYADIKSGYCAVVLLNTFSKDLRSRICDEMLKAVAE